MSPDLPHPGRRARPEHYALRTEENARLGTVLRMLEVGIETLRSSSRRRDEELDSDDAQRTVNTARAQLGREPHLLQAEPLSLVRALLVAAKLHLRLEENDAFLVLDEAPGGSLSAVLVPCAEGIAMHAHSDWVDHLRAHVVFEGDELGYELGLQPELHHVPRDDDGAEPGKITHAYAVVTYENRTRDFEVLNGGHLRWIRSAARRWGERLWEERATDMARKAAIRQLAHRVPGKSIPFKLALRLQSAAEVGADVLADIAKELRLCRPIEAAASVLARGAGGKIGTRRRAQKGVGRRPARRAEDEPCSGTEVASPAAEVADQ